MKTVRMFLGILAIVMLLLAACGPAIANLEPTARPINNTPQATVPQETIPPLPTETISPLASYYMPLYYPGAYIDTIEKSKKESGLTIYSIMSAENWKPVIQAFNEHFPWIKVTTVELKTSEVFTRYESEVQAGTSSADLVISTDPIGWLEFIGEGNVRPYRSQEDLLLPEWSKNSNGLYTVSTDPTVLVYNKNLVSTPPNSIATLIDLVKSSPDQYKGQVTTYDIAGNATGFGVYWAWAKIMGDNKSWSELADIGAGQPMVSPDRNVMVQAVATGKIRLGYFISSVAVFPNLSKYPNLGWSYVHDGQPIILRYMALTKKAASPNSAKMMIDFLLSQEGQLAIDHGGLTPYRSDITGVSSHHLNQISQDVGEANLIFVTLDPELGDPAARAAFLARWQAAMQITSQLEPTATP